MAATAHHSAHLTATHPHDDESDDAEDEQCLQHVADGLSERRGVLELDVDAGVPEHRDVLRNRRIRSENRVLRAVFERSGDHAGVVLHGGRGDSAALGR